MAGTTLITKNNWYCIISEHETEPQFPRTATIMQQLQNKDEKEIRQYGIIIDA